ncbi:BREX-1 system adenine-specific DNA-methyltransferase PglX [Rhodanobacter soli]|uniref:BREX-1 system adenine-specific DNA-methyltransferase PglX n=1 Tax=Rhodanobacter soli TaxID=590609 RepID=UPI0031DC3AD8
MNTGNLKSYAPQARKDFIAAVTARANLLGLSEVKGALQVAAAEVKNDIVMIAGRPWPVKVNEQRTKLIARMKLQGFGHTVEAMAYAWFNRLAALRYMEVHDYLGHGRRVLSNLQGGLPEVLAHALDLAESNALPGLPADTVRELKLANQDPQLYRLILIAQCNALHQAMPFLFEHLGDETELLLPENLLLTDSVVAKLVQSIPEEDWQQIEIIGWLYQFYISEKKDQVIGKVVKSEDIPAATQLFTPNWIVKYMVQNSLGAQWLATYPDSPLKAQMEYYIEPAEQTDEVNAQLAAITPSSLDPEELTLIDPASGSGHILVEAYDLFRAIYLERGYRQRDAAKLILEKNLFGLDIDERAAQLTGFALMMKARADDRQLFERGVKLNVMALVDSTGFDAERLARGVKLADFGLGLGDLTELKELFEYATTFGSLIRVPEELAAKLPALKRLSKSTSRDLFISDALTRLNPLVQQGEMLATQYDAVVANPPYMGSKYFCSELRDWAKTRYNDAKSDLFACFIERGYTFAKTTGREAMVTMQSWMFLSSFQGMRERLLQEKTIQALAHLSNGVMGIAFGTAATVLRNRPLRGYIADFSHTSAENLNDLGIPHEFPAPNSRLKRVSQEEFKKIPGSPIAYWVSSAVRAVFGAASSLQDISISDGQNITADNATYLRLFWEIDQRDVGIGKKWFFYAKGGDYRKWWGNLEHVVDWTEEAREFYRSNGSARIIPEYLWYRPGVTWTLLSSSDTGFRYLPEWATFDKTGSSIFMRDDGDLPFTISLLCSQVSKFLLGIFSSTIAYQVREIRQIPIMGREHFDDVSAAYIKLSEASKTDWDAYERSWDFQSLPLLTLSSRSTATLESSYTAWITQNRDTIAQTKRLEEANNRLFIDAYGLQDELTPDVPIEQITLTVNPAYRYGGKLADEQLWTRFRQDTMAELVSYAIGCMMGRYSLDAPGLIYANSGNVGFDASRYTKFPADADGIVPVTDELWFEDDAALRVREFLLAEWGEGSLEQNMAFLADNLGRKASESPEQAIRRYLADKFFKDHLQTYKKRPIYWLFSSGKQGAFQALVYLHRYNAGTLSRLRAEYVVPLTGKMQTKMEELEQDVAASSSTAQRNKLTKQLEKLRKQHLELLAYDEQLRHYADQRITLDLDDGVKLNYGKFGDLLAEVKAVTGGKGDDE